MRILQIDKFFYNRGGSSRVFFDTIKGLRERGHEVSEFSMLDEKNFPSEFSSYFAPNIPELQSRLSLNEKWKIFKHLFRSEEVEKKLKALVLAAEPEVAHIHNAYHQLSASTFLTLRSLGVPMVMTLHDFFPLCPNHNFMHGETMGEKLYNKNLFNCVRYKCVGGKLLPSIAGALEAFWYRYKKIWDSINAFICPSQFMRDRMLEYGFPENKMVVVPNPFAPAAKDPAQNNVGNRIVYLGRMHAEKGIKIFVEALESLRDVPVTIAGSGPLDEWVDKQLMVNNYTNVERRMWVGGSEWQSVMKQAKVIVVPSVFYENCSLAILEALSMGKLVVATDRGGNPEHIINGKTGFLAKPEDPKDLARALRLAMGTSSKEAVEIGQRAQNFVTETHAGEHYFTSLESIYKSAKNPSTEAFFGTVDKTPLTK